MPADSSTRRHSASSFVGMRGGRPAPLAAGRTSVGRDGRDASPVRAGMPYLAVARVLTSPGARSAARCSSRSPPRSRSDGRSRTGARHPAEACPLPPAPESRGWRGGRLGCQGGQRDATQRLHDSHVRHIGHSTADLNGSQPPPRVHRLSITRGDFTPRPRHSIPVSTFPAPPGRI